MRIFKSNNRLLQSILAVLLGVMSSPVKGQVYLYLEDMTKIKAIKIPTGSQISVKTIENSEWTTYYIDRLLADSKSVIFEHGMIQLEDITHIRIKRRWVAAIGTSLERFGMGWGLYGAIALATSLSNVEPTIVIAGTIIPLAVGWLIKKMWLWKKYKIGSKNRLKILDLSFPDDPYGEKTQQTYSP